MYIEEFKKAYMQECLVEGKPLKGRVKELFDLCILNDFGGDNVLMDSLIQSLADEYSGNTNKTDNEILQDKLDALSEKLDYLTQQLLNK